jgi:hypothetical protein
MSPIYRPKTRAVGRDGKLSEFEQLLKETFTIYKSKISLVLVLAVILMVNSLVLAGGNYFVFRAIGITMSFRSLAALIFWLVVLGFTVYVYSVCQVILLSALKERDRPEWKGLFKRVKAVAVSYAKLYVYVRLLIFAWMLPFIAAMVALLVRHGQPFGSDAEIVSTVAPALPLIIPGVVFILLYAFASYIFVYEKESIVESVKRSKQMVSGCFWQLLGKYALLLLLNLAVYYLLNWAIGFLPAEAAKQLLSRLVDSLIAPVYTIFGYLLYKEVKELKTEK